MPFKSIANFSKRLSEAAGKSCNIELVLQQKKIGGNAPILASALINAGHPVIFAGTIGKDEAEPLFLPLSQACQQAFFLGPSSHSDALEFPDGKIILGKLENILSLTFQKALTKIGAENLTAILEQATLFAAVNWTMTPMMNDLWVYLRDHIASKLSKKKRYLFIDFADPAKRTDADLKAALDLLKGLNHTWDVILGLNKAEAVRLAEILQIEDEPIEKLAEALLRECHVTQVVIHTASLACAASKTSLDTTTTPFTPTPLLTTGAGDNFNGGYCSALLAGRSLREALISGVGTAGFYVRNGKSPTPEELAIFLDSWHNNTL